MSGVALTTCLGTSLVVTYQTNISADTAAVTSAGTSRFFHAR